MMGREIKIDEFADNQLLCPDCSENYLHHESVDVYWRTEDAEKGQHIHTHLSEGTTLTEGLDGNPSRRRHGLSVRFWCEHCDGTKILNISQHKGNTYMSWGETEHE